jgi:hypothetical protein
MVGDVSSLDEENETSHHFYGRRVVALSHKAVFKLDNGDRKIPSHGQVPAHGWHPSRYGCPGSDGGCAPEPAGIPWILPVCPADAPASVLCLNSKAKGSDLPTGLKSLVRKRKDMSSAMDPMQMRR